MSLIQSAGNAPADERPWLADLEANDPARLLRWKRMQIESCKQRQALGMVLTAKERELLQPRKQEPAKVSTTRLSEPEPEPEPKKTFRGRISGRDRLGRFVSDKPQAGTWSKEEETQFQKGVL